MTKLTESEIIEFSRTWGIRVNQIVAKRFMSSLDTDKTSYIESLLELHGLGCSQETIIALEYVLLKLYNPKPGYKGECGAMPKPLSAVDRFIKIQKGESLIV